MNTNPFISIVVPTYNRAHLIVDTINSLLQQDYPDYEVLVVDDGSTDNTQEIVTSIQNKRLKYFKKENAERAAARNYGAQRAKGDYVNFFDSDDIAHPNHLTEAARVISKHKKPEWFHLGYAWATPDQSIVKKFDNYISPTSNHLLPHGNPVGTNTVFIRKDIALANPFDEDRDLSASEDYELWLRLAAQYPFHSDNVITSFLTVHSERSVVSSTEDKLAARLLTLLDKVTNHDKVSSYYKEQLGLIKMEIYSYLALHLSDMPDKKQASLRNLWKAFRASPRLLLRKRFYANIRNILTVR
jgi:glycosyltransferase involved in cell wall biosynthesis